ncbi:hypothetical protein BJY01DRAFT_127661 [Aspergillus pseudoustus]|uniref:Uncharacterized protein n=1 Tax=Aspergillus pseudoustus TaxID=1810923 RepID=A0ABR4KEM2_9EURO
MSSDETRTTGVDFQLACLGKRQQPDLTLPFFPLPRYLASRRRASELGNERQIPPQCEQNQANSAILMVEVISQLLLACLVPCLLGLAYLRCQSQNPTG